MTCGSMRGAIAAAGAFFVIRGHPHWRSADPLGRAGELQRSVRHRAWSGLRRSADEERSSWESPAQAACGAGYFTATVAALLIADVLVRRYGHAPPYFVSLPRLIVAVAIGIYEASYAMCTAPRTATIEWRGITYDILGKNRIQMRAYLPYPNSDGAASTQSVV
jgi:hypothetical protein